MCIVIDANTFAAVFSDSCQEHEEFEPVLTWIIYGKGKIIYGGSKYEQELRHCRKYLGIFSELRKVGKVVVLNSTKVDYIQQQVEGIISHSNFDDPHIVAIVIVSGCRLICSNDGRAHPFFKDKNLYPKHFERPRIYSGYGNRDLLCDQNLVDICEPHDKLPKTLASAIFNAF
jgi:hypothetical protein